MYLFIIAGIIGLLIGLLCHKKIESHQLEEEQQKLKELEQDFLHKKEILNQDYTHEVEAYQRQISQERNNFLQESERLHNQLANLNQKVINSQKEINEVLGIYEEEQTELVDAKIKQYQQEEQLKLNQLIAEQKTKLEIQYNKDRDELITRNEQIKNNLLQDINSLQQILEDYQKKRQEINEAILREREIQEKRAFYSIQISDEALQDMAALRQVLPNLHNADAFNKLLYDLYIARPVKEMEKRVLNDESFSGIYKITSADGQVYIGKSTDIKARWQQHAKSTFHCGTISRSSLHAEMERKGIDTFSFEVLERVPKENLTTREKFWIEFYGADKYGLNMRVG